MRTGPLAQRRLTHAVSGPTFRAMDTSRPTPRSVRSTVATTTTKITSHNGGSSRMCQEQDTAGGDGPVGRVG